MKRCLLLAQKGIGTTRPNPSVGAVIVVDNTIIGEGFTSPYGGPHAEVQAIRSVQHKDLLRKATLYVTLEPCSHHGKTPPCSDLIVKNEIPKVVIGCVDSNSLVSGTGIEKLKQSGVEVICGILEVECREHHKRFFTFHEKKRPYIILKWAETKDGFMAPLQKSERKPIWITNELSRQVVHQIRAKEHAILVGTGTVVDDNPRLNVRKVAGLNPIRIVIDRSLKIPKNSHVFDGSVQTLVITEKTQSSSANLVYEQVDFKLPLAFQICSILWKHKIQSLIVEGGTQTLQTFIEENLWDEAYVFKGDLTFGQGVKSPIFDKKSTKTMKIKSDELNIFRND